MDRFGADQRAAHLHAMSQLTAEIPAVIDVTTVRGKVVCTVIAFDQRFEFSLITGVLAGMGLNIERGDVYTLTPATDQTSVGRPVSRRVPRLKSAKRVDFLSHAVIVDVFRGSRVGLNAMTPFDLWASQLSTTLLDVLTLLGQDDGQEQAKQRVNELVTAALKQIPTDDRPMLFPIDLKIEPIDKRSVLLTIAAQDTPAYLYALSTALSLRGMNIVSVRIDSDDTLDRIVDTIELSVPPSATEIDTKLLERIKLSALLTKQFTYFLDNSPDPFAALSRFEQLAEDLLSRSTDNDQAAVVDALSNPTAMRDLAKLLGTSRYIWEDFIRGQYEMLAPIFKPHLASDSFENSPETLAMRLAEHLASAVGLSQQQDRLNQFKDRELFAIDLEHILTDHLDFQRFSERLTQLAELLVGAATRLVYDDLVRSYGPPKGCPMIKDSDTNSVTTADEKLPYAVFGLGKLGGVALGYASDIELLFVYDGKASDQTRGGKRKPISHGEFFHQLAAETSKFIRTRRSGIFEVDLRLRPYGKEGPLASNVSQFGQYYASDGPAHRFEQLALVRLRWLAGNPSLGYDIEQKRDEIVYGQIDWQASLDQLWEIWGKSKTEKLSESSQPNAKYSHGALVDLEGAIQLLQVMHASVVPQLRVPRLSQAMEALQRGAVLQPADYGRIRAAYAFFRQLINALRVLRGSAVDLFLPEAGSLELTHLARRMQYEQRAGDSDAQTRPIQTQLLDDLSRHSETVKQFIRQQFDRPCAGESEGNRA